MIRRRRGEEQRERADILVLTGAANRNELAALEEFHHRFVMREDAGHDAISLNPVLGVGQRERAGELQDRTFRTGVHIVMFAATETIAGSDIDDLAALA